MSTEQQIERIILEHLNWDGSQGELTEDYPLIETHVIDSLSMLELISHLESEFGIKVDDEDLVPSNFATVKEIARFVESKSSR